MIPASALTVGGLLKHLAVVEDDVFCWWMSGRPPVTWKSVPEDDVERWQLAVDELLADGGLDQAGHSEFRDARLSVRRQLHDLIEEYGRHTGHMDLLREAIDGRVGEDPSRDWPMLPADRAEG